MKTYEQLQQEWGASTCGREFSFYVYEYFQSYAREVADKAWMDGYMTAVYEASDRKPKPGRKEDLMRQLFPESSEAKTQPSETKPGCSES